MGWNKSAVATNEKLRLLPTKINSNTKAIEEADETSGTPILQRAVLLPDRSDAAIATAANPTVVGATTYLFSKQDAVNLVQELFVRTVLPAAPNNIIQMTEDGRIGSSATNFQMNQFRFGTNETTYNAGNIVKARGTIGSGNTVVQGSNIDSVVRTGTSIYTIQITADVLEPNASANYQVFATPINAGGVTCNITSKANPVTLSTTAIVITTRNSQSGDELATQFDVMVTGGV